MNNTDDVINGFNCGFKFQNITYVGICQPIGVLAIGMCSGFVLE